MMRNYFISIIGILIFITGSAMGWKRGTELRQHNLAQADLLKEYADDRSQLLSLVNTEDYHTASEYILKSGGNRRLIIALSSFLGRSIYEQEGLASLSECFNKVIYEERFGCIHGFLSVAVSQGHQWYDAIYDACMALPTEHHGLCTHAVGHALIASKDYSIESVNAALKDCEYFPFHLRPKFPYASCKKGVLMEYFLARLGAHGTGVHKAIIKDHDLTFDKNRPYDICAIVLDPDICYGQIVNWWLTDVHLSRTEIARLCFNVPTEEGKRYCFVGLSDSIAADIEPELEERVLTNFNGALGCKDILNYDDRLSCYHNHLIQPLLSVLTERIKRACAELSIGEYTQMCIETNMERVSSYERQ